MTDSTEAMLATQWQHSGRRDVYKDFNALTLQITTQALFGDDLPAAEGLRVTGQLSICCMLGLRDVPHGMHQQSSSWTDSLRQ